MPDLTVICAQAFVNQVSGHEGAEVPDALDPDVSFDDPAFWRELKAALGVAADKHGLDLDLDSDSAPSSDGFDDGDDDDSQYSNSGASSNHNSEDSGPNQPRNAAASSSRQAHGQLSSNPSASSRQQQSAHAGPVPYAADGDADGNNGSGSEVLTATDSDDEEADFMHAYDEALAQELSGSRVGNILQPTATKGGHQGSKQGAEEEGGSDLKPVDLDTNLVRNLLQSYTAQQGLAGPAGNLAGLLGLNLPDDADTD